MITAGCTVNCKENPGVAFIVPPEPACGCDLPWVPAPIPPGAPLRVSAVQVAADTVKITFNQPLVAGPITPSAFTVNLVGVPGITIINGSTSGSAANLVLSAPSTFTVGTVTYVPSGTNDLKALDDNTLVAPFSGYGITPM